ncbi:MAG: endonuclease domain-containing protein [Bacteroidetes bacterium]|nr:endonuclease domain-containing protein [Bacteroidota bacterium]
MDKIHNKSYLKNIRLSLRNNMTSAEAMLWNLIKNKQLGVKFRRQHSIGNYVADFYCPELRIAIEMDGGIHNEISSMMYDETRDNYLLSKRIKVIRFSNLELFTNEERVIEELIEIIELQKKKEI